MSVFIPSTSSSAVTQAQLTTATNACVKKSQLTTTGAVNEVPQLDSSGTLKSIGLQVGSGALTAYNNTGSALFQQSGTTNYAALFQSNTGGATNSGCNGILIQNVGAASAGSVNLDMLQFMGNTVPTVRIQCLDDSNYSAHALFFTRLQGAGNNTLSERMRLTSTGNLVMYTGTGGTTGNISLSGTGGITLGTNGLTAATGNILFNSPLNVNANAITQTGAGSITTGTGGLVCGGRLSGPTAITFTAGASPGQYTLLAAAGTGALAVVTGNSLGGNISITAGSGSSAGQQISVAFPIAYTSSAYTTVCPANSFAASYAYSVSNIGYSGFGLSVNTALVNGTTYSWNYTVAGS